MTLIELIQQRQCKRTCEVGCLYGKTSQRILDFCNVEQHILVDPWVAYEDIDQEDSDDKRLVRLKKDEWERMYKACCNTVAKYGDKARIIRKTSVEGAKDIYNFSLDCVIIDANHTRKAFAADALVWLTKICADGIFVAHDYSSGWKQIVKVIDEIFGEITRLDGGYAYKVIDCKNRIESIIRAKRIKDEL